MYYVRMHTYMHAHMHVQQCADDLTHELVCVVCMCMHSSVQKQGAFSGLFLNRVSNWDLNFFSFLFLKRVSDWDLIFFFFSIFK